MADPIEFLEQSVANELRADDIIPLVRGRETYQLPLALLMSMSRLGYALARETKVMGENGGRFPPNEWYARPLNEHRGLGGLVGRGVQLPAGKYLYFGFGLAMQVQSHQTRLFVSDGSFSEPGLSSYSPYALATLSALGPWEVEVNGSQIIYLEHRCGRNLQKDWGLGYRTNFGLKEVFAGLLFLKVS